MSTFDRPHLHVLEELLTNLRGRALPPKGGWYLVRLAVSAHPENGGRGLLKLEPMLAHELVGRSEYFGWPAPVRPLKDAKRSHCELGQSHESYVVKRGYKTLILCLTCLSITD